MFRKLSCLAATLWTLAGLGILIAVLFLAVRVLFDLNVWDEFWQWLGVG